MAPCSIASADITVKMVVGSSEKTGFGRIGMAQIDKPPQAAQRRAHDTSLGAIHLWMR
jgi:hypothetical protein